MTQNLDSEIERVVSEYEPKLKEEFFKPDGVSAIDFVKDYLRQSLRSIAEKTVEAMRVEEDHLFYPFGDESSWMNKGWDKAITEQSKLASCWLGKE